MTRPVHYLPGLDLLRIVAAFGVVWIHGCDTNLLIRRWSGYVSFAVPVFVMMAFFLMQMSWMRNPAEKTLSFIGRRVWRLLPAYLVWTCLYVSVRSLKHQTIASDTVIDSWGVLLLMGGASYQLYFVMLIVYWTLLFGPVMAFLARQHSSSRTGALLVLLGITMLFAGSEAAAYVQMPAHLSLIQHAIGLAGYVPVGIGAAILYHDTRIPGISTSRRLVLWIMLIMSAAVMFISWELRLFASSIMLFALALCVPASYAIPHSVSWLAKISFGIFLVHGFFVEGFQMLASGTGFPLHTAPGTMIIIASSYLASVIVCGVMYARRKTRWLVT